MNNFFTKLRLMNFFKKIIFFYVFLFLLSSCSKENLNRNPYLKPISFNKTINLNLPKYDNLKYSGGSVFLENTGIKGVLLFNLNEQIMAWESSCPNHLPSSCSTMEIKGVQAECKCENYQYSLATGQILNLNGNDIYPMLSYMSEKNGSSVRISN